MMEKSLIKTLHTLGPHGTNCEIAAQKWFEENDIDGEVLLYDTLEDALQRMPKDKSHALMGCVAYPKLHNIVFSNLDTLTMMDCLIAPTDDMVLAQKKQGKITKVASHPAPRELVPEYAEFVYANSNSHAAKMCDTGLADACITTRVASDNNNLLVAQNFGQVMMGFTVHGFKQ